MKNTAFQNQDTEYFENPYNSIVLHLIPRILTNLDRDRDSPTYGCFDRNYWHYKVHDYSSGLLQQCSLTLALAYLNPFEGNSYFNNGAIREYAIAGVRYCTKIQNRDGSFDEYWKGESSIPSTAFTLYSICETCDLLKIEPDERCIAKAVHFLATHREDEALNQEMASIAAIRYAAKLLRNSEYMDISDKKFEEFLSRKKTEGWFSEYGGVDVSYLTVNLDYMVRYYQLSDDPRALEASQQVLDFLRYFIHPDGSIGGEYGTRNTEYFAPYGIEYLKQFCPVSNTIIEKLLGFIHQRGYLNLSCDERYYLHYLSHSFTKSLLRYSKSRSDEKLPCECIFERFFDESKIFIKSTENYYFIANLSKGGTFKVMNKNTSEMSTDCGFRLKLSKDLFVTELPQDNRFTIGNDTITVSGQFLKMNFIQQSTSKLLLLRVLSAIGGFTAVRLAKKIMIFGSGVPRDMVFNRTISFTSDRIQLSDTLNIGNRSGIIRNSNGLSVRHTASSRFFQIDSLGNSIASEEHEIHHSGTIERSVSFGARN